jgi:hypothetical protein
VVLEIEDIYRRPLITLRLTTPNVYQLTAQVAVAVACEAARGLRTPGWITPAQALEARVGSHEDAKAEMPFAPEGPKTAPIVEHGWKAEALATDGPRAGPPARTHDKIPRLRGSGAFDRCHIEEVG